MASAARELRYHSGRSIDGSLAHDLDWAAREHELHHAGEAPRHPAKVQEKAKAAPKVLTRQAQRVSLFSVAGVLTVAALSVLVLMSYIHLTEISAEMVTLKKELAALETENIALSAQHEQMFDLASVRNAAEASGMRKPSSSQIYYIDLSGGDSAVVLQDSTSSILERLSASLHHGVYAVVEYFD